MRKIYVQDRFTAKLFTMPPNSIRIAIWENGGEIEFEADAHVHFNDVLSGGTAITNIQGGYLFSVLKKALSDGVDVYVNCQAGISRSAGVAAAAEVLGFEWVGKGDTVWGSDCPTPKYFPNETVKSFILSNLNKG